MKRLILFITVVLFFAGCAATSQVKCQKNYSGKKLKTGFYIDRGSRGGGVTHLGRLMSFSPQIELTMLTGEDLQNGKLNGLDLLVMPGGSSNQQMKSMGPKGVKAVQDFVRNGGAYVGVCAGFHITLNRPERARLMPYTYFREAVGAKGDVQIDLSAEGAKLLDVAPGKRMVRYSRGPVAKEAQWNKGTCKTYAVYTSSISPLGKAGVSFFNTPALIAGTYGKGKVIATSFHPEYKTDTYELFTGCVYAVTGVKITPQIPQPEYRALRTAYYSDAALNGHKQAIKEVIALEKHTKLAVTPGFNKDLLNASDLLILPNAPKTWGSELAKTKWMPVLVKFMERGGKIIAAGDSWHVVPDHKNLIRLKAGDCVVKAALNLANE